MSVLATIRESFVAFCDHFRLQLYPHQREDFGEATRRLDGRFCYPVAAVSYPRGDGKSHTGARVGLWRLLTGAPGTHVLNAALDVDGAGVVLEHARRDIRSHPELQAAIEVRANSLLVPATGSRWTVTSREHTSSRGKHPAVVIYDECGWARDDELFASLLAGQASVEDPLMLVISTVGRRKAGPLWTVKELAEGGDPAVLWRWHGENRSPKVTREFIDRQRRILLPAQFAREHQNQWVDAADALTNQADVDAAMNAPRVDVPVGTRQVMFVDLGTVHDPSVIATGCHLGEAVVITRLETFQGSHDQPVQIADVQRRIAEIPDVDEIRIESWQGVQAAQALTASGHRVELFAPTAKAHAEEWPLLVQQLAARSIILPKHARLREELLNLVVEVGPQGVRVIDRGKIHQDHAVAVRGVVAMLVGTAMASHGLFEYYRQRAAELTGQTPADAQTPPKAGTEPATPTRNPRLGYTDLSRDQLDLLVRLRS